MKKGSSHEYEGINMDDQEETTNALGVYTVIGRNPNETAGKQIGYIVVLTLKATGCSSAEKDSNVGLQKYSLSQRYIPNI